MAWTSPRTWIAGEVLTAALLNTHLRDQLLELNSTASAWTSFTPSATNFSFSAVEAYHKVVGKTVHVSCNGLISGAPTGTMLVTLPFTAKRSPARPLAIGTAYAQDVGNNNRHGVVALESSSTQVRFYRDADASPWAATFPFTWAASDILSFTCTYEAA
jgi:hypothetical protein